MCWSSYERGVFEEQERLRDEEERRVEGDLEERFKERFEEPVVEEKRERELVPS